jgi:hypothetical protein
MVLEHLGQIIAKGRGPETPAALRPSEVFTGPDYMCNE